MKVTIVSSIRKFSGGRLILEGVGTLLSVSPSAGLLSNEPWGNTPVNSPKYVLDDPENQQLSTPVRASEDGRGSTFMVWAYRNRFVTVHQWAGATSNEIVIAVAHAVLSYERLFSDMESDIQRFLRSPEETATPREPVPEEVRRFVWRRDQGCCVKCGSNERLEYDHIIPLANGGSNTERNIQLLCEKCNRSKGAMI